MRIFKNSWFVKFARREDITDDALKKTIIAANDGLVDANLGGGLIKLRIAREGAGKSGGYRTIVCFSKADRAVCAFGFAKNDIANLSATDLAALKKIAKMYLTPDEGELEQLIQNRLIEEIIRHD